MIEYVPRSGPPEAMNCPAVICDTCREQVVGKGNIVWAHKLMDDPGDVPQQSPIFAAHKGACDRALDMWLKQHYGEGWILLWEELATFMRQLAHNAENTFADDPEGEYHQQIIKQPASDLHTQLPPPR